jgi:hypothetical protein
MVSARLLKVTLDLDSSPVSYAEVLRRWQHDTEFCALFIALLADAPFAAFRWETLPITTATESRPFEFVLLDSPGLASTPDANAFARYFNGAATVGVVEFPNLGRDAIMIVPCPLGARSAYGHLAAFVREAPESQKHALWQLVGAAMFSARSALRDSRSFFSRSGSGPVHEGGVQRPGYRRCPSG